ncbi:hypothetical protein PAMA_001528 [Pampus argenteus]
MRVHRFPQRALCMIKRYLLELCITLTVGQVSRRSSGPESGESRRNMEAKMRAVWVAGVGVLWALMAALVPGSVSELVTLVHEPVNTESSLLKPKVMIAIVARNAAHSLPHYLGCIERLEYPKERIAIWAATDHNMDNTTAMLREWLKEAQRIYHYVEWRPMEEPRRVTI